MGFDRNPYTSCISCLHLYHYIRTSTSSTRISFKAWETAAQGLRVVLKGQLPPRRGRIPVLHGSILGDWQCRFWALMAVARKIKTLLTVNILVFVGIILFSVYCRIQDRSEELVQIGRLSDQRLRGRNAKVTNSMDRQSILKRLERLEDVVYNQLNGK